MMGAGFRVAALDTSVHQRDRFHRGVPALDRYLLEQVSQDVQRRVAACFVALAAEGRIAGFYTLAAASVPLAGLPEALQRKLPRYAAVPVIRMGRLAFDAAHHGQGRGGVLLVNALRRASAAEIGAVALVVDAKDERASAF